MSHPFALRTCGSLLGALTLAIALLACRSTPPSPASSSSAEPRYASTAPLVATPGPAARTEDEQNTIAVFRAVAPSTVFVTQTRVLVDFLGDAQEVAAGSGSGFVWDEDGHVVTNFHVVEGARSLRVTFQNQRTFDATLVGVEPRKDIAVLKVGAPRENLKPVVVGQHLG